jgi:hypothetical protein
MKKGMTDLWTSLIPLAAVRSVGRCIRRDDRLAVRQLFISDYGFRIQSGPDHPGPMFDRFGWPRQAYSPDTDGLGANPRCTSVISAQCIKIRWGEQREMHLYGAS